MSVCAKMKCQIIGNELSDEHDESAVKVAPRNFKYQAGFGPMLCHLVPPSVPPCMPRAKPSNNCALSMAP